VITQQIISIGFIPGRTQLSISTFVQPPAAAPTPGFASLELSFDGEGMGAGLFMDA